MKYLLARGLFYFEKNYLFAVAFKAIKYYENRNRNKNVFLGRLVVRNSIQTIYTFHVFFIVMSHLCFLMNNSNILSEIYFGYRMLFVFVERKTIRTIIENID